MNIRDFLIDNYIWILVVILLTIITIIGFLADKKKGKKEAKNVNTGGNTYNNAPPINYQNIGGQAPVSYQPNIGPNNQNMGGLNIPNPMGQSNNFNNFQMNANSPLTPNNMMGQAPQVNQSNDMNMGNMQGNILNNGMENSFQNGGNSGIIPSPVPTPQPLDQFGGMNMGNGPVNTMSAIPNNNPQPIENINNNNLINAEPMYQPLSEQKPIIAPKEVPNFPQNLGQQENPMGGMNNNLEQMGNSPTFGSQPEQANPQININYQQPMNNTLNQQPPVSPMPNPIGENTIPSPIPNTSNGDAQPVNFVYGPQNNNNNQFM